MQIDNYVKAQKDLLREIFFKKRKELMQDVISNAGEAACQKILELSEYKNASKVLLYSAVSNELSLNKIFLNALKYGKQVYFPRVLDNENMEFIRVYSDADFKIGCFNILEPTGSVRFENDSSDALCIVPAISYDKSGFRLGYGKGYYDRYLCGFSGTAIGFVMENFILDNLPRNSTDINVKKIITDKNIYTISF